MAGEGIIQLYSGQMFNVRQPRAQDIIFEDIAISLSRLARFNGHSQYFYSVAQHSILVTLLVPYVIEQSGVSHSPEEVMDCQRLAFMHDAHEAYIGDIPRPLKMFCNGLWDLAPAIDAAVASRFGLVGRDQHGGIIKAADRLALATERRDVLGHDLKWEDDPGEPCLWLKVTPRQFAVIDLFGWTFDRLWGIKREYGPLDLRGSKHLPHSLCDDLLEAFPTIHKVEAKA